MGTKAFRLNKMDQYIIEHKMVTIEELSKNFGLSVNTVRTDIQELEKMGRIQKVYGGACSRQNGRMQSFEERSRNCIKHKKDIAFQAAELVEKDDIIFIDSGTTAMYMVDYLDENKNVTILTHNLGVVMRAMKKPSLHLICLPGELDRVTNSLISEEMYTLIKGYHIDKAFFSTAGISATGDVTTHFPLEFAIKQELLSTNSEKYLLTDASKFGKATGIPFAKMEDFEKVIIDNDVEDIFLKLCSTQNVSVLIASQRTEVHLSCM